MAAAASPQCPLDAIVVCGGGIADPGDDEDSNEVPLPALWAQNRLDAALQLAEESAAKFIVCLSRGTTHKPPPLLGRGFPMDESAAMSSYLQRKGFPVGRILVDGWSLDTIGNAFFFFKMFAEPFRFQKCAIITSEFHMLRTQSIFQHIAALSDHDFDLTFQHVPNVGISPEALVARENRERRSLETWEGNKKQLQDMESMARFLFLNHAAYNAEGNHGNEQSKAPRSKSNSLSDAELHSY